MSKIKSLSLLLVVALSLAAGVVGGIILSRNSSQRQLLAAFKNYSLPAQQQHDKISATLSFIDEMYVDPIKVDTLTDMLMDKLLGALDPHSSYIPAKDFNRVNESLDGEFDGIGVVFNMATDTVIVLNVISAGPSAKAGIMARDRIIMINDTLVAGQKIDQDKIVSKLRGERGTPVMLGIERGGVDELVNIEVIRGKIPIHSIGATMMIEGGAGYINMSQFSRTTYSEFIAAANKLLNQGMTSMILDLRGNSGGYMDQAIAIATEFLSKGELIVYTEDRAGKQIREYSERDGQLQNLNLIVLIDEGSASSSEIVAGALQDNDRGTIIGRRSFGKGLVQRQIPYPDGSAIRLTTARYFTPTGRSIQKPYEMGQGEEYELDLLRRIEHDELFTADSIAFADSLKFITPKGKTVYGGGGIMPDIFVPISKDKLPKYYQEIAGKNILYNYTIEYSDRNRDALAAIETLEDMDRMFDGDRGLVDDFVAYAARKGVSGTAREIGDAREILERQLRAFIGRNTKLEDNGYYYNIYPLDDALMRALDELKRIPTDSLNL